MTTVALDVSICTMLGVSLRSFPLYRVARSRGIGETDMARIHLKGESLGTFAVSNFEVPALDSIGLLPARFDWFTKRFLVSKPVQERKACGGCGQCAEICPADAVEMEEKKIRFDYDRCIRCYCCQEVCPEDAIFFRKGLLVKILNRFNR